MNRRAQMKALVRCPDCSSGLIYPVACSTWERQSVLERRCPECEHRDLVITNRLAAAVWIQRCNDVCDELSALADALASGLSLELPATVGDEASPGTDSPRPDRRWQ
jgi:hypothetical protein